MDFSDIVDRHKISAMNKTIGALGEVIEEWTADGNIPEVDWSRMRALDFQESIRTRDALAAKLPNHACLLCADFKDHVSSLQLVYISADCQTFVVISQYTQMHAEMLLRTNIDNLKLAISDQNLELIPDYEQRVAVLQELKFIDANSTVLLKGRVACEVRSSQFLLLLLLLLIRH